MLQWITDINMLRELEVIDNFLDITDWQKLHDIMIGENFPWFFHNQIALDTELIDSYYFTHMFYWNNRINSPTFDILIPLLEKVKPSALVRIKGNFYPNLNKTIINNKHTDFNFKHRGGIYYINTNNGKTILDDGTEIASVANRMIFFDSSIPHQSTHCTDQKARININLNFF